MEMSNTNTINDHKTESIRKSLLRAGYDMAAVQAESMEEDSEYWESNIINGKINPKCIDISDQASHSFYCGEFGNWCKLDKDVFPENLVDIDIYTILEDNGFSDDVIYDLLFDGANVFITEVYGQDWKEKYPDPIYK